MVPGAAERQAHAEIRRLLAAALELMPSQLEPPAEPREAPSEATPQPERVRKPQLSVEGAQEGAQPRSWWRRMFGG